MINLFVSYELANLAKEKGFNEPCIGYYNDGKNLAWCIDNKFYSVNSNFSDLVITKNEATAPLYQQLVDWLRINHDMLVVVYPQRHGSDTITAIRNYKDSDKPDEVYDTDYYVAF